MKRRGRTRSGANRRGAAIVEFAIVAPVFFLVMFASIEFIRLNMIRNLVQDAAYFAARDAMVPGATAEEAEAAANRILGFMNTRGASISINDGGRLNDQSGVVTVSISVPVSENSFLIPSFTGNLVISARATLNTERYSGFYDSD